jgi:hypothetical protein
LPRAASRDATLILISLFLMPETRQISIWKEAKTAKAPA